MHSSYTDLFAQA